MTFQISFALTYWLRVKLLLSSQRVTKLGARLFSAQLTSKTYVNFDETVKFD